MSRIRENVGPSCGEVCLLGIQQIRGLLAEKTCAAGPISSAYLLETVRFGVSILGVIGTQRHAVALPPHDSV